MTGPPIFPRPSAKKYKNIWGLLHIPYHSTDGYSRSQLLLS